MSQHNAGSITHPITYFVKCFIRNQGFKFPAYSLTEVHQLLQACRQIEAEKKPLCIRWKTHQWILQFIKKCEKDEKNPQNDDSEEYEKFDDPHIVFSPQLLESVLPADGLRGKIQMFALRWRYSFTKYLLIAGLLLPKNIYEYCRYQKQLKKETHRLDAEFNAEKNP